MKKLQLKMQELNNPEILTREQLKNVLGGSGGNQTVAGSCAHAYDSVEQRSVWCCGLTQSAAQNLAAQWTSEANGNPGGLTDIHWCTASCSQSTSSNCDVPA